MRIGDRALTILLSILLGSTPLMAKAVAKSVFIAQQPAASSHSEQQQATVQAEQLMQQAQQLLGQGTAQSQQQAIAKYQDALVIWRQIGNRPQEATTLLSIGTLYYSLNENQKALDSYERALAIRRELNDRVGEAVMLFSMGGAYSNLGENQKALEYYNQALALFQTEKQPSYAANTLRELGRVYFKLGETQKALDSYHQALVLQQTQKALPEQAETLQAIGRIYTSLGEPQKALEAYNRTLEIQRGERDEAGQADTLGQIGVLYTSLGETQKALAAYHQALTLQQAAQGTLSGAALVSNLSQQAILLAGIAGTYTAANDYQQALTYLGQARSFLQKAGNRSAEAEILNQISFAYDEMGETQKALGALNEALALQRVIRDSAREAFTLSNIAAIYNSMGEPQKALDFYDRALEIQRRISDRPQQAVTLNSMAQVYRTLGDYQLSINTYTQALEIFKRIGDRTRIGQTLDSIGNTYRLAGDYAKALDSYNQELSIWRGQGDLFREVATLTGIIRAYEALGDYPKGLDAANQALSVSRQAQNSFAEASALALMGRVYLAAGEYPKALDLSTQALELFQKLGIRPAQVNVLGNLGKIYQALQQPDKALDTYNQELVLRRQLGDRTGEAETLYNLALTQRNKGNLNIARTQIEDVIKIVEDIRTKVTSQELRTSYFASVQKYYQFYIDLLMQLHKKDPSQGYDALALNASERARARSLLDLLAEAHADIRTGVEPNLLAREQSLQQKLDALEKHRLEGVTRNSIATPAAENEQEISALLEEYQQVQAKIRATSPRYAALTQPQPLTLAAIQQQVLDDDTLLLQYSLGEERSYLWAVTKTGITSYELPKRAEIEATAQQFYKLLKTATYRPGSARGIGVEVRSGAPTSKVAIQLSQMLLQPVAEQLGNKRLLVVSDGALQYIPFAALPMPGTSNYEPLLVKHEIVNSPSASSLAVLRTDLNKRKTAPKAIAVFADPVFTPDDERLKGREGQAPHLPLDKSNVSDRALARAGREADVTFNRLPFTRTEAEQILALVPADSRLQAFDFAASRATATSPELSQYRIVHFATHGILNSKQPELSGVVLSLVDETGTPENGFLRLHDVFNLNLPAELVVLSACQTGLGEEVKGEGLVGLTRGFMYAGSPRVVVSLWNVDDEATSQLMAKFYKKMLQDGVKPAAALRAAQLEMWQQTQWQAPFYWAAFTLQGEWR